VRKGAPWLKTTLVSAAWAAVRVKESYLQAQFHRLRARRGAKKAILAVASSMLTAAYHMLKNGVEYKTSVPATSLAVTARRSSCAWFDGSMIWDAMSNWSRRPPDKKRKT